MNAWFHCNRCQALGSKGGSFLFTSCGHIICKNCFRLGGGVPNEKGPCVVCQKPDSAALEISRSMRSDVLEMFRPPKDLLAEKVHKVKTVMDFQTSHYQRLVKSLLDKCGKAMKFARNAQAEIAKSAEREQSLLIERKQLKMEVEKGKEYANKLENLLAEREREIQHLRQHKSPGRRNTPYNDARRTTPSPHVKRGFPSLNGVTPLNTLSFFGCATSTPFEKMPGIAEAAAPFDLFGTPQAQNETPQAGGGHHFALNTPALFGLASEKRTSSTLKNFF